MKYLFFTFSLIAGIILGGKVKASSSCDYGLYLRSHSVGGPERTCLFLDDNHPFIVQQEFSISFQMYIRSNEPDYGSILHLRLNNGQIIHLSLIGGEGEHQPALVLNDGINHIDHPIERERWIDVSVQLRRKDNIVEVIYDGTHTSATIPLQRLENVMALFGRMEGYQADVAPVNIKNIRISQDGKHTREWKLQKHNDDLCYDEQIGAIARAQFPFWLIDNHIEWKPIYQTHIFGKLNVAFDAREARFFLVDERKIKELDENGIVQREISINGGYPAINYSNHIVYDTLRNELVSYSLRQGKKSSFSFSIGMWSNQEPCTDEPRYSNHARTFNPADSSFYFFGGYGFYQYRSDLFRMKSGSERVEQVEYERPFYPRFSSAMAVVGDELYIFGGRGNKYGKQELTSEYFYGLCALNLRTKESRLVWKRLQAQENTIMASSMYFNPADSSFYAVSLEKGGTLWKVSIKDSICSEVSKPIKNLTGYQDMDFSLYASPAHSKFFLVMDKIQNDRSHMLFIYSINMPLLDEADIRQATPNETSGSFQHIYIYSVLIVLLLTGAIFYLRRKSEKENKNIPQQNEEAVAVTEETTSTLHSCESDQEEQLGDMPSLDSIVQSIQEKETVLPAQTVEPTTNYYDRSQGAISLLGCFNVRDKKGCDITANFTPRLKQLLILLVLYSEKYSQGILASKATEILWPDKEERAARNNRNVTLRKLRILLESIGDVEIITENNFLHIRWGEDVFCDYHTTLACIRDFHGQEDEELLNRILELLLYGPLLPNTILNWLDNFKDAYSSNAIDLLRNLLELELQHGRQEIVLRLADIMFLHDPLNEEALTAKCAVLSAQGKKGIARNVYDRFCKEYHESMGEKYKVEFADL